MTITPQERPGGVRVLQAAGELDVVTVPPLLAAARDAAAGATGVVLDLTGVTFFDSSGVRLVDRLCREAARSQASVRVVAPAGSPARRVLEVVGMGPLVADDVDTAVAAVVG